MITKKSKKQKKGFTLIELLVVIVIIGILASLLLPAITSALGKGKGVQCMTNLKNYYAALLSYYTDFKSLPPVPSDHGGAVWLALGNSNSNYLGAVTFAAGGNATGADPIYQCPLAPTTSVLGYRGPILGWTLPLQTPKMFLGCDIDKNHGTGMYNALRGDGGVAAVPESQITSTTVGTPGGDTAP